tara:strand:- start:363 stop:473 length:111 start_codon:yes stop_codon:yes gene_type:complete
MKIIGIYIYGKAPTGEWLRVGEVVYGVGNEYVEWYN